MKTTNILLIMILSLIINTAAKADLGDPPGMGEIFDIIANATIMTPFGATIRTARTLVGLRRVTSLETFMNAEGKAVRILPPNSYYQEGRTVAINYTDEAVSANHLRQNYITVHGHGSITTADGVFSAVDGKRKITNAQIAADIAALKSDEDIILKVCYSASSGCAVDLANEISKIKGNMGDRYIHAATHGTKSSGHSVYHDSDGIPQLGKTVKVAVPKSKGSGARLQDLCDQGSRWACNKLGITDNPQ